MMNTLQQLKEEEARLWAIVQAKDEEARQAAREWHEARKAIKTELARLIKEEGRTDLLEEFGGAA